jgi:hypothetical protein
LNDAGSNLPLGERVHRALVEAANIKIIALAKRKLAERVYDRILLDQEGSIAVKEAKARIHEKFIAVEDAALKAESEAIVAKAHADGLAIRFEQWRTEQATTRAEMQLAGH